MQNHLTLLIKKSLLFLTLFTIYINAEAVRIMPMGDSITRGYPYDSGYRKYLWYKLQETEFNLDFVGTQNHGTFVNPSFDTNHEGHNSIKSYELEEITYSALEDTSPDIILLHIGSNDTSPTQGVNSSSIAGVSAILNEIDRYETNFNHPIRVMLASIINRRSYHTTITQFNNNLRAMATTRIANGDKITLVNMETDAGLNSSDFSDATHPNYSGYSKMANVWFNTLTTMLPPPIPDEPTNLIFSENMDNTITLQWNDNATNELGFQIYQNGVLIDTVNSNVTSYILTNLEPRSTYTYTIVAYNTHGTSDPITITFTTKDDYRWLPAVYHVILN